MEWKHISKHYNIKPIKSEIEEQASTTIQSTYDIEEEVYFK